MELTPPPPEKPASNIFTAGFRKIIELTRAFNEQLEKEVASAQQQPEKDTETLRITADDLIAKARGLIAERLSPEEVYKAMQSGQIVLLDIRPYEQRLKDGLIPGAVLVNTNVFEYRCDPASPDSYREPSIRSDDYDQHLVVICNQGYKSSLEAANLVKLGLRQSTDVIGGMEAWIAAGLPTVPDEA